MTIVPDVTAMVLPIETEQVDRPTPQKRHWMRVVARRFRRLVRRVAWTVQLAASAVVLVGVLAVVAAVPVLGLYVLGYLLTAQGRVARGERWRGVLPWVRYAPRVAAISFGTSMVLLPVAVLADIARDAALIDPTSDAARTLRILVWLSASLAGVHLFFAYARGGPLMSYVRPIKNLRIAWLQWRSGRFHVSIADRLTSSIGAFQIPTLTWMGMRGLVVAFGWLLVPCMILAVAGPADGERLLLKFGGIGLLSIIFPSLLVLQTHFAAQQRIRAGFAPREALRLFGRAPMAWLMAGLVTAVLSVPLFLFKIVAPPRDAFWMLTPMFVAAMLPARIVAGLAYRRSSRRTVRRSLFAIGCAVVGLFAVGFVYSTGVFVAQYINEHGRYAIFEQHAFSLPVPFVGDPR